MEEVQYKQYSILAILSAICLGISVFFLILYIVFLCLIGQLILLTMLFICLAFGLGVISFFWILFNRHRLKGYWISILVVIISTPAILLLIGFETSVRARSEAYKKKGGYYSITILGNKLIEYANAHDNKLPPADIWCDVLLSYDSSLTIDDFHSYIDKSGTKKCLFAFNKNLSEISIDDISPDTILLFVAGGQWNQSGSQRLLSSHKSSLTSYVFFFDQEMGGYVPGKGVQCRKDSGEYYYRKLKWQP